MTTRAITYREASRQLIAQARAELEAGDLRQASEKAWGAAAQMAKASRIVAGMGSRPASTPVERRQGPYANEVGQPGNP